MNYYELVFCTVVQMKTYAKTRTKLSAQLWAVAKTMGKVSLIVVIGILSIVTMIESFGIDPWAWARPERRYRVKAG